MLQRAINRNNKADPRPLTLLSNSERENIILAIRKCWVFPLDYEKNKNLSVTLTIELHPSGALKSRPVRVEPLGQLSAVHHAAYQAAERAIYRCAPYDNLPKGKYSLWKNISITFDPKNLLLR